MTQKMLKEYMKALKEKEGIMIDRLLEQADRDPDLSAEEYYKLASVAEKKGREKSIIDWNRLLGRRKRYEKNKSFKKHI